MKFQKSLFVSGLGVMIAVATGCSGSSSGTAASGAGAALSCTSSGKNAYTTYGSAFVAVNEQIFSNVMADSSGNLGTSFTKIGSANPPSTADGLAAFKGRLAAFLVYTYGGPASTTYTDGISYYGPQDMTAAHTGLAITSAQYDYFVNSIVVPALTTKGVPSGDISSCFAPPLTSAAFKASIVGK